MPETEKISVSQYMDIIFDMVFPKMEYLSASNLIDFVQLATRKLLSFINIESEDCFEILFIEMLNKKSFIILNQEKKDLSLQLA